MLRFWLEWLEVLSLKCYDFGNVAYSAAAVWVGATYLLQVIQGKLSYALKDHGCP